MPSLPRRKENFVAGVFIALLLGMTNYNISLCHSEECEARHGRKQTSPTKRRLTPFYNSDPTPTPPSGGAVVASLRVGHRTVAKHPKYRFERLSVTPRSAKHDVGEDKRQPRSDGLRRFTIPTPPQPLPREGLLSLRSGWGIERLPNIPNIALNAYLSLRGNAVTVGV